MNACAPQPHHPLDELAAFALDAVDDPAERRAVEAHLARCPACRARLATHERVLASLVGDQAPPASLWDAIATRVAGQPPAVGPVAVAVAVARVPGGPAGAPPSPAPPRLRSAAAHHAGTAPPSAARPGPHRRERRRTRRLGLVAAAAALVAAVAAAPLAWGAWRDAGRPAGQQEVAGRTVAVLTDPAGRAVARVVERPRGTAVLLDALPALPAGRSYQLWSLDGARPASLALLGPGAGPEGAVPVTLPPGTTRVAVSDEPSGGSPVLTGMVAAGRVRPRKRVSRGRPTVSVSPRTASPAHAVQ